MRRKKVSQTELAYAIGSYFWICNGPDEKNLCALVRVDSDRVALIHMESGNRFADPVQMEAMFEMVEGRPVTSISKIVEAFKAVGGLRDRTVDNGEVCRDRCELGGHHGW